MNLKRILYVIQELFGMKPERKYADTGKPCLSVGLQYAWSRQDPDDLCTYAIKSGAHILSCELAERGAWDEKVGSYDQFIAGQIKKAKKLAESARFWKIWLKIVYLNTNADYAKPANKSQLVAGMNKSIDEIGIQGVLWVPCSEFDSDTTADERRAVVAAATSRIPQEHLVLMVDDIGRSAFEEHHIQRPNGLKSGGHRMLNATDSRSILEWLNKDGVDGSSLIEDRAVQLGTNARSMGTSFELYGFWKSIRDVLDAWERLGRIYKQ